MKLSDKLKSDKLSYKEKVEVACKELPVIFLQQWAVECAESVLHIYEKAFPDDTRVRDCINIAKKVIAGELDISAAYSAANAANAAYEASVDDVAYNVNISTVYAAFSAKSAAWAASAAISAVYVARSAASAASSATSSAENEKEQEELNIKLLLKQVEVYESPLYQLMQEVQEV